MRRAALITLALSLILSGCGGSEAPSAPDEPQVCTLPLSYCIFVADGPEDAAESIASLGEDYFSEIRPLESSVELYMTDAQLQKLLSWCDENIDGVLNEFSSASELYSFEGDNNSRDFILRYDEELPLMTGLRLITVLSCAGGLKELLLEEGSDWAVHFEIVNCHSGKTVDSFTVPTDSASFGADEWAASYN